MNRCAAVVVSGCLLVGAAPVLSQPSQAPTVDRGNWTPQERENVTQAMRLYEEAYNADRFEVADEIFTPDYIRHDASDPVQGPGEAVLQSERAQEMDEIVPDGRFISYDAVLADGDMVAVRWTVQGTPTGLPGMLRRLVGRSGPITMTGTNTYRFRDGRVVEVWNSRDDLAMMRGMGMFRLYAAGGLVVGVLAALLAGWLVRRRPTAAGTKSQPIDA